MTIASLCDLKIGECTSPFETAGENLALEQLLASRGTPCFITHRDRACVSIGFNQDLGAEVDVSAAREAGVDIVRRPTGGGAVYRDKGCICYSFVVPERFSRASVDLIMEALRALGFPVEKTGRNDLFLKGRKVSGLAWESVGDMSIVHGTVLHSTDIDAMDLLVGRRKGKYRGTAIESVHARVANLSDVKSLGTPDEFQAELHRKVCGLMRGAGARVDAFWPNAGQREAIAGASSCFACCPSSREHISGRFASNRGASYPPEC